MKALGTFLVFALGVAFGVLWTVAMLPDISLKDLFGESAAYLNLSDQIESMGRAFRGILIGLMWAVFGLVIAAIVIRVTRLFGAAAGRGTS